jgi:D-alanyl-D-alanine carboxypeptidase (penicillin-binding protein 5/6)
MRSPVVAAVAVACLALAVPASAGAQRTTTVGGPQLAGTGVLVDPLPGAPALPSNLTAGSWLVADADTGAILATKAPHERFLPASTLKTLTAVTLLPMLDPNAVQKISYDDAAVDGSKVGLVPGGRYKIDTLFTSLLVVSANDAADALAEAAGGLSHTVDLMNAEAQHLQAFDTVARTPSGLDAPGESSSAYDLALIGRAGLAMPDFRHYIGIVTSNVPAPHNKHFQIYTHNHLLTTFRGDIGIKNGYTVKAGATYIGAATRGGHTIIITLMHDQPSFWAEARALLTWGFAARDKVTPVGQLVDPAQPAAATSTTGGVTAHPLLQLAAKGSGGGIASWEIAALSVSAATMVAVTTRRLRRRRSRLALPPL